MNKLFVAVALSALTLTGCLKSNGYSGTIPPTGYPGARIYMCVSNQNTIALQPANFAVRLAILQVEAAKAGKGLNEVTVPGGTGLLKDALLSKNATIEEKPAGVYEITFQKLLPSSDGFEGTLVVDTKGVELPASKANHWTVTVKDLFKQSISDGTSRASVLCISEGTTELYFQGGGVYSIQVGGLKAYFEETPQYTSSWSGSYFWSPAAEDLDYKECSTKEHGFSGDAYGQTFYLLNDVASETSTEASYSLKGGKYLWGYLVSGSEVGRLMSNYDSSYYPSSIVSAKAEMEGDGSTRTITRTFSYNGMGWTETYTLTGR